MKMFVWQEIYGPPPLLPWTITKRIGCGLDRFIHLSFERHVCHPEDTLERQRLIGSRYIVTELMDIDLQTLLRSKPIQGEFVQYLLYQIMVCLLPTSNISPLI